MVAVLAAVLLVATLLAAPGAAAAHKAKPKTRVETPVRSASPDARTVKESYVRLYSPLPASDGARPPACNWVGYLRFRSKHGPKIAWKADAIFVTMPGIFAGASSLDQFARNVVRAAAKRHRHVEVWALDRRSNCLEDHGGIQAAAHQHVPKLAFDYYFHGARAGGHGFPGFATPQQAQFLSGVGLAQTARDEYTVITRGVPKRLRKKKVFCGGHSLGGPLTTAFADWDFGGGSQKAHAGYQQCRAFFALDTRLTLSIGSSGSGSAPSSVGIAQALAQASHGSPYVNAPPFTPENIEAVPLTALAAYQQRSQQSQIATWLPNDANFEASYRLLFSQNPIDAVTQIPSWRDFRLTNEAALGGIFDSNSTPIVILRSGLGTFNGPVQEKSWPAPYNGTLVAGLIDGRHLMTPSAPHGPLYSWIGYRRVGLPAAPVQLDSHGQPFVQRAEKVTDIHQFARAIFEAPADFVEQYFPTRLLNDQQAAGNGDRSGDLQSLRYDGIAQRPTFYADAQFGIEAGAASPPKRKRPFKWIRLPGYHHLDVGTAAWSQNNGKPEPESAALVGWALRVLHTRSGHH